MSILRTIQDASVAAKVLAIQHRECHGCAKQHGHFSNKTLSISALFYLATAGGASVCGLENLAGKLEAGKAFDALLVSIREDGSNLDNGLWGTGLDNLEIGNTEKGSLETQLERFLFTGDDRNIKRVYVQGKLIGGTEF